MNPLKVITALFLITAAASVPLARAANEPAAPQSLPPSSQIKPAIGVAGYVLQSEYRFGTAPGKNIRSISDLQANFTPDAPWGRINGELQHFTNFLPVPWGSKSVPPEPEAAKRTHQFEADALILNSNHLGGKFTYGNIESGSIVTNATVKYPVIVEVLAKLPKGRAHWPSIWLYDYHSVKHTADEIDILESQFNAPVGQRDNRNHVYQNSHGKYTTVQNFLMDKHGRYDAGVDLSKDYHYYSCQWFENGDVDMYVDGKRTVRRNIPWPVGEPNIIVMLSTGSDKIDWPGPIITDSKDGTDTFSPDDPNSTFKIRHIRIFKPAASPAPAAEVKAE